MAAMFRIAAAPACLAPSLPTAGTRTAAARAGVACTKKITTIKTT
jgi:hypothetical protein